MTQTGLMVAVDSLVANEFEVEIEGEKILGVFRAQGLIPFKLNAVGERVYEPFQLVKMVQRDGNSPFNKWLRESSAAKGLNRPRRELAIVAIDDGIEIRRWVIRGAWIGEVSYADFDTASSAMVEEIITIYCDHIEEIWSATPKLE